MAVIGTFNGVSIITMPAEPGARQFELAQSDMNAMNSSPFTGASQMQAWPGSDQWSGTLTLPPLSAAQRAQWSAFLGETRGMLNAFLLAPPDYKAPQGVANHLSKPVVSGANNAMTTTLVTKGWRKKTVRLLMPGDYIQIGPTPTDQNVAGLCRLHQVLHQVDSDGSGNATLTLWPSLRETVTDGTVIVLKKPQGLFRLAENKRSMLTTETRSSTTTFHVMEAR